VLRVVPSPLQTQAAKSPSSSLRLEDHIEELISPRCIAERLDISSRQLERLFGRYLNATPTSYFVALRLHRARNLLVQTDCSITEIAFPSGFKSSSYFSRAFRAFYGRTPLSHRTTLC
jgi:transcriptional regulator GlxA family with amidase domain